MSQVRILSSRLQLTQESEFFYFKRKHRKKSVQDSKRNERADRRKGGKDATVSECSRLQGGHTTCPTGGRILSSRLQLTQESEFFYFKRKHRKKSVQDSKRNERADRRKGGKDATVSECSRLQGEHTTCPTGRRILSSRLSLTKYSKAFFILNGNTEKRPYRIRSVMSAPAGEKVTRTPPSANEPPA